MHTFVYAHSARAQDLPVADLAAQAILDHIMICIRGTESGEC